MNNDELVNTITVAYEFINQALTYTARSDGTIDENQHLVIDEVTETDNDKQLLTANVSVYQELRPEEIN